MQKPGGEVRGDYRTKFTDCLIFGHYPCETLNMSALFECLAQKRYRMSNADGAHMVPTDRAELVRF